VTGSSACIWPLPECLSQRTNSTTRPLLRYIPVYAAHRLKRLPIFQDKPCSKTQGSGMLCYQAHIPTAPSSPHPHRPFPAIHHPFLPVTTHASSSPVGPQIRSTKEDPLLPFELVGLEDQQLPCSADSLEFQSAGDDFSRPECRRAAPCQYQGDETDKPDQEEAEEAASELHLRRSRRQEWRMWTTSQQAASRQR
jgi:hypothetical protein